MSSAFLKGTGVALITPFTSNLSIDFDSLSNLVNHVIDGGVEYLVVMGTTGESVVLTADEKQDVLSHIRKINQNRVPIVLGIGGNDTLAVVKQIEKQDLSDISGLLSVCPYYNKPNQKGLYAHFAEIAKVSPVPIILYNVPGRTGSYLTPETTLKLAEDFEQIIGIKEASGQLDGIMKIIAAKQDEFIVISGDDGITLPLIALGVEGVISVAGNAVPYQMSEMVRNSLNGDFKKSRICHYNLWPLFDLLFREGNPAGVKAALHSLGLIQNEIRLPLTAVSQSLYQEIAEYMKKLC